MGDDVRVTVIATGFDHGRARPRTAREGVRRAADRSSRGRTPQVESSSLEIDDDDIDIPEFLR